MHKMMKQVYMLNYPRVSMGDSVLFEGNFAKFDGGAVRTILLLLYYSRPRDE